MAKITERDGFFVATWPNDDPRRTEHILVFDDDYRYVDPLEQYSNDFSEAATVSDIRGYSSSLLELVKFFDENPWVLTIVFSDLPSIRPWDEIFDAAVGFLPQTRPTPLILLDYLDEKRRRPGDQRQASIDAVETALVFFKRRGISLSRVGLFTAGISPPQKHSPELGTLLRVLKGPDVFREKLRIWWNFATKRIDASYFETYTAGRHFLHNPETAVAELASSTVRGFVGDMAAWDCFGAWGWLNSVISKPKPPGPAFLGYVYLCCKDYLRHGDGATRSPTFNYTAIRALTCGMPFAITRAQYGAKSKVAGPPDDEIAAEVAVPIINRAQDGRWGVFTLNRDKSFQSFATALFDFLFKALNEPPSGSRQTFSLSLSGSGTDVAILRITIGPTPLHPDIFRSTTRQGTVSKAWFELKSCVTETKETGTEIRLLFPKYVRASLGAGTGP